VSWVFVYTDKRQTEASNNNTVRNTNTTRYQAHTSLFSPCTTLFNRLHNLTHYLAHSHVQST
jgi:hypothetical protein